MPIIHLATTQDEVPAGGRDVTAHTAPCMVSATNPNGVFTYWTYTTHHGLCLEDRERNGYDDSDFYMIVWDPATGQPDQITYATTRGWSYPCYGSSVDATDAVRAAYAAWQQRARAEARRRAEEEERATPRKGKTLRILRGPRKGLVGTCTWVGVDQYKSRRGLEVYRVGLRAEGEAKGVFTAMDNVVVVADDGAVLTPPHTARILAY